eukprot:COSAG02_NODE_16002_length_1122_cov_0.968719_1_plen_54_part_10
MRRRFLSVFSELIDCAETQIDGAQEGDDGGAELAGDGGFAGRGCEGDEGGGPYR